MIGEKATSAIPILVAALKEGDVNMRTKAACALGKAGANSLPAALALAEALKDRSESVREEAAVALGNAGENAKSLTGDADRQLSVVISALVKSLDDLEPMVRVCAVEALVKLDQAQATLPVL